MSTRIVRTWKRDGTINRMSLDAAAHNLLQWHRLASATATESLYRIRERLEGGYRLESPLASFQMDGYSCGEAA